METDTTIDQALDAFMDDQRRRLSDRTMRNYEDVVCLLRDSLNGYAYESLDKTDAKRFDKAYQAGDEEAFCHLFGPEPILDHLGGFLGYFMVRKVMGSQGTAALGGHGHQEARHVALRTGLRERRRTRDRR